MGPLNPLPDLPSHYSALLSLREGTRTHGRTTVARAEFHSPRTVSWTSPSRPTTGSSSTRPSTGAGSRPTTGSSWRAPKTVAKSVVDDYSGLGSTQSVFEDDDVTSPSASLSTWDIIAVGHVSAMVPVCRGMAYEVSAAHREHAVRKFEMRSVARSSRQRPQMYLGVTAIAPEDGFVLPSNPYKLGQQCWMISASSGYLYNDGNREMAALATAHLSDEVPRPPTSTRATTLRLLVTKAGSIELCINDEVVATSRPDFVPHSLASRPDALFPIVVLGPNVSQVTLRRAK